MLKKQRNALVYSGEDDGLKSAHSHISTMRNEWGIAVKSMWRVQPFPREAEQLQKVGWVRTKVCHCCS